jgi:hypothetical protein
LRACVSRLRGGLVVWHRARVSRLGGGLVWQRACVSRLRDGLVRLRGRLPRLCRRLPRSRRREEIESLLGLLPATVHRGRGGDARAGTRRVAAGPASVAAGERRRTRGTARVAAAGGYRRPRAAAACPADRRVRSQDRRIRS